MVVPFVYTEEEYKKLEEERDFFKEQAILWRNDYKNEYEENTKLKEELRGLRDEQYTHWEPVVSSWPCFSKVLLATRRKEKLIKLLNEFNKEKIPKEFKEILPDELEYTCMDFFLTKEAGFIERLVENNKIDLEKYKDKSELYTLKVVHWTDYYIDLLTNKVNSDFLLMILSIQDNPLEYLCSILKE